MATISSFAFILAALVAVPAAAETTYFTIRFKSFENGNDAPTLQTQEAETRARLQTWLDSTKTDSVEIQFDETTLDNECEVVDQRCWQTATMTFRGPRADEFAGRMKSEPNDSLVTKLDVAAVAVGKTIAPREVPETETFTQFILTVLGYYFGISAVFFIIFFFARYKLLQEENLGDFDKM